MSNSLTEEPSVGGSGYGYAGPPSHTRVPRGAGACRLSSGAPAIGLHRRLLLPAVRKVSIVATLIAVVALALWPSAGLAAASPPLRQLGKHKHVSIGSAVDGSALANDADYAVVL